MIEAILSSVTLVLTRATRRYIPEEVIVNSLHLFDYRIKTNKILGIYFNCVGFIVKTYVCIF
jgi:hypothetical protein